MPIPAKLIEVIPMDKFNGLTAKEIKSMIEDGRATKTEAIEFLHHRVDSGYKSFSEGEGRKPRYKSVRLLADLKGTTYEIMRDEMLKKYNLPPVEDSKNKTTKPKKSKTSHDALDKLSVAYVEADVCKLVNAKTTKAAIARMNQGGIKDPLAVANLREAERRLGYEAPQKPVQPDASARLDALESKLDELIRIFG